MSLYTYRTPSPEALRARVVAHGATSVTTVQLNEFGERCFGFVSPDGYAWNIIEGDEVGTEGSIRRAFGTFSMRVLHTALGRLD